MTDNSQLTLRWEIDNAAARAGTGKIESGIFEEGGFKWTVVAEELTSPNATKFTLNCGMDLKRSWKCEGEVEIHLLYWNEQPPNVFLDKARFRFDEHNSFYQKDITNLLWYYFSHPSFNNNAKVIIEISITIIDSERCDLVADPAQFAAPNRRSDVILKIGEEKLHVSKELLAVHSPVFEAMFFGDYAEKGKEEIEIKDVVYEEFLDLLHFIYIGDVKISDRTVVHILKLADQYQIESVFKQAKMHLTQSKKFDIVSKLAVADQYNLVDLRDHCLNAFATSSDLIKSVQPSPEFDKFSEAMKAAICVRIMKLGPLMASKWKLILRWEIDDAVAKFATGNVESEVFDERGFLWNVAAKRRSSGREFGADFVIRCGVSHNRPWKCDAVVDMRQYKADGKFNNGSWDEGKVKVEFNANNHELKVNSGMLWHPFVGQDRLINGKAIFVLLVNILSSEGDWPIANTEMFAAPNRQSNVILKIGDKRIHVSKEYLAVQSPVFEEWFFGDSAEKGKEEVEIEDVVYEEFLDLLHLIYLGTSKITDQTVAHILNLADQFEMKRVVMGCRMYLKNESNLNRMNKILLADQYGFPEIKDRYLRTFNNSYDLFGKMRALSECVEFSDDLKVEIFDKIAGFKF